MINPQQYWTWFVKTDWQSRIDCSFLDVKGYYIGFPPFPSYELQMKVFGFGSLPRNVSDEEIASWEADNQRSHY